MDLRAELMAAMAGTTEDERAWIPLRRGVVEAVVAQLTVMEQVQKLLLAFTPDVVVSEPVVREPSPMVSKPVVREPPVKKSVVRYERDNDGLKLAALAEIKRLARDGMAPTMREFDERRNPSVPNAKTLWVRLGVGYRVLVSESGLQSPPMGRHKSSPTKMAPTNGMQPTTHATNGAT